jgi:uncharacterized membrane protein YfhO
MDTPDDIKVQVDSGQEGWLVLADSWYSGWEAMIDGQEVPLLHADYNFKAVAVGAGTHQVQFVYRPLSFYLGMGISLLAISFLLFITFRRFSP